MNITFGINIDIRALAYTHTFIFAIVIAKNVAKSKDHRHFTAYFTGSASNFGQFLSKYTFSNEQKSKHLNLDSDV